MNNKIKKSRQLSRVYKIAIPIISLMVLAWIMTLAHSFFLPSIKLINQTDRVLDVYVPQYPYIVEDNKIYVGCCPSSQDMLEMGRKRGAIYPEQAGTYSLSIRNLYYPYPDDFFMLEVEWRSSIEDLEKDLLGSIGYRLLDSNENQDSGVCHVTATVTDEGVDIKESAWKYCFKKISKDIGVSIE